MQCLCIQRLLVGEEQGWWTQPAPAKQQLFSSCWWQNFWALSHQLGLSVVCRSEPMWVTPPPATPAAAAGTNKAPVAAFAAAQNWPGTEPVVP